MEKISNAGPQKVPTFGLLPEPKRMSGAYIGSAVINVSLLSLFIILSLYAWRQKIVARQQQLSLIIPIKQDNTPKPKPVPRTHIQPPPPDLLRDIAPKIVYPHQVAENAPRMLQVRVNVPNAPVLPPYNPVNVALPPQPKVGMFQANVPTAMANNQGRPTAKTGGFGDPVGARTNPNSSNSQVAAYGSFQNSIGEESGAGSARKGSVHGVAFGSGYAKGQLGGGGRGKVSTAGFGNNVIGGIARGPQKAVQEGAFHNNVVAQNAGPQIARTETDFRQVQVLYHPRPEYTPEAKHLRIQGEVVLEVRFTADGSVEVLRVVRGLGHGLDQQAIRAAEQTRFKPAMKDGRPVDMTTYYRIDFQLA